MLSGDPRVHPDVRDDSRQDVVPQVDLPMGCKPTGLHERLSRPKHNPKRIAAERRAYAPACRRLGLVYADIAQRTGLSEAEVTPVLWTGGAGETKRKSLPCPKPNQPTLPNSNARCLPIRRARTVHSKPAPLISGSRRTAYATGDGGRRRRLGRRSPPLPVNVPRPSFVACGARTATCSCAARF